MASSRLAGLSSSAISQACRFRAAKLYLLLLLLAVIVLQLSTSYIQARRAESSNFHLSSGRFRRRLTMMAVERCKLTGALHFRQVTVLVSSHSGQRSGLTLDLWRGLASLAGERYVTLRQDSAKVQL